MIFLETGRYTSEGTKLSRIRSGSTSDGWVIRNGCMMNAPLVGVWGMAYATGSWLLDWFPPSGGEEELFLLLSLTGPSFLQFDDPFVLDCSDDLLGPSLNLGVEARSLGCSFCWFRSHLNLFLKRRSKNSLLPSIDGWAERKGCIMNGLPAPGPKGIGMGSADIGLRLPSSMERVSCSLSPDLDSLYPFPDMTPSNLDPITWSEWSFLMWVSLHLTLLNLRSQRGQTSV